MQTEKLYAIYYSAIQNMKVNDNKSFCEIVERILPHLNVEPDDEDINDVLDRVIGRELRAKLGLACSSVMEEKIN